MARPHTVPMTMKRTAGEERPPAERRPPSFTASAEEMRLPTMRASTGTRPAVATEAASPHRM